MYRTKRLGARFTLMLCVLGLMNIARDAEAALPTRFIECGATIGRSIRVANNITGCDNGLVVTAPNITVDLGGHVILGNGGAGTSGVADVGHDGVTIRGGMISGFAQGIYLEGSQRNIVEGLTLYQNRWGIVLNETTANVIRQSTVINSTEGISAYRSSRTVIRANTLVHNAMAMWLGELTHTTVAGNVAKANDNGIVLDQGSDDNLVEHNLASANTRAGIDVSGSSSRNRIAENDASANSAVGIVVASTTRQNVVVGNKANENGRNGIDSATGDLVISDNQAHRNGFFNDENGDDVGSGVAVPSDATGSGNVAGGNDDPAECTPAVLCTPVAPPQYELPSQLVSCEEPIDTSLRIANSISGCERGLIITAPDITVDLGGHVITAVRDTSGNGIVNTGQRGVTIRNGVVRGFYNGVRIADAEDTVTEAMMLVESAAEELVVSGSEGTTIERNYTIKPAVGSAIVVRESPFSHVARNISVDSGILLLSSPNSAVKANTVSLSSSGVFVSGSQRNAIVGNRLRGNVNGLVLFGSGANRIKSNDASANHVAGIYVSGVQGSANRLIGNRASENGTSGIESTRPAVLTDNVAHRNGFLNGGPGDDHGLGIHAEGARGGDNRARRNDDPDQCLPRSLCSR